MLDKLKGQSDKGVYTEKSDFNMELIFLSPTMTNHLKILGQKIVEFSKTPRSICGDIDLPIKEAKIQRHHLACNQFF